MGVVECLELNLTLVRENKISGFSGIGSSRQ